MTGRLIDKVTGRVVPPADVEYTKAPDNVANGDALAFSRLADAAFGLTVPPGRGMIAGAAAVEGTVDPYVAAHLKAADQRRGEIEDRLYPHKLVGHHTYRIIDVPAGSGPLAVDLELTRGPSRAGRLTGPDGLAVVGAEAYGLSARDWSGPVAPGGSTPIPSRSGVWSRATLDCWSSRTGPAGWSGRPCSRTKT